MSTQLKLMSPNKISHKQEIEEKRRYSNSLLEFVTVSSKVRYAATMLLQERRGVRSSYGEECFRLSKAVQDVLEPPLPILFLVHNRMLLSPVQSLYKTFGQWPLKETLFSEKIFRIDRNSKKHSRMNWRRWLIRNSPFLLLGTLGKWNVQRRKGKSCKSLLCSNGEAAWHDPCVGLLISNSAQEHCHEQTVVVPLL